MVEFAAFARESYARPARDTMSLRAPGTTRLTRCSPRIQLTAAFQAATSLALPQTPDAQQQARLRRSAHSRDRRIAAENLTNAEVRSRNVGTRRGEPCRQAYYRETFRERIEVVVRPPRRRKRYADAGQHVRSTKLQGLRCVQLRVARGLICKPVLHPELYASS